MSHRMLGNQFAPPYPEPKESDLAAARMEAYFAQKHQEHSRV